MVWQGFSSKSVDFICMVVFCNANLVWLLVRPTWTIYALCDIIIIIIIIIIVIIIVIIIIIIIIYYYYCCYCYYHYYIIIIIIIIFILYFLFFSFISFFYLNHFHPHPNWKRLLLIILCHSQTMKMLYPKMGSRLKIYRIVYGLPLITMFVVTGGVIRQ